MVQQETMKVVLEVTEEDLGRFFSQVEKTDTCWLWRPGKDRLDFTFQRLHTLAYRFSYLVFNGTIPDKMFIRHTCDNQCCVNPDHLLFGTQGENMRDMYSRGRHRVRTYAEIEADMKLVYSQQSLALQIARTLQQS